MSRKKVKAESAEDRSTYLAIGRPRPERYTGEALPTAVLIFLLQFIYNDLALRVWGGIKPGLRTLSPFMLLLSFLKTKDRSPLKCPFDCNLVILSKKNYFLPLWGPLAMPRGIVVTSLPQASCGE